MDGDGEATNRDDRENREPGIPEEAPENCHDQHEHEDGEIQGVCVEIVVSDDRPDRVAGNVDVATELPLVPGHQLQNLVDEIAYDLALQGLELDDDACGGRIPGDDDVREERLASRAGNERGPLGIERVAAIPGGARDRARLQRPDDDRHVQNTLGPADIGKPIDLGLEPGDELERRSVADRRADSALRAAEDDQDMEAAVELLEELGEPGDGWIFGTEVSRVADLALDLRGLVEKPHSHHEPQRDGEQGPPDAGCSEYSGEVRESVQHGGATTGPQKARPEPTIPASDHLTHCFSDVFRRPSTAKMRKWARKVTEIERDSGGGGVRQV